MTYNKETGRAATNRYRAKFDMIQVRVPQGERDKIAEHAANRGESMNSFVYRAIQQTIENDNLSTTIESE